MKDQYGANCRLHPGAMFKPSQGCPTCEVGGAPYVLDANGFIPEAKSSKPMTEWLQRAVRNGEDFRPTRDEARRLLAEVTPVETTTKSTSAELPPVVEAALEHVRGAGLRNVACILEDAIRGYVGSGQKTSAPRPVTEREGPHCPTCECGMPIDAALAAADVLAHQSIYTPFHEKYWTARGGHGACTVCNPRPEKA